MDSVIWTFSIQN